MRVIFSILFSVFLLFDIQSQDLANFTGLKSTGDIPSGFLKTSAEKSKEAFSKNNKDGLDKTFFLSTRFVIDQLLQSGKILFNEPLSIYLNEVAKYALKGQDDLLNELKFYVLKSTEVNAFSTDQGIIFFTTGLLAQLENEAQLAYILLHEVSHYTEKHVQDSYVERKAMLSGKNKYSRLGYDDRLNEMSVYKKSNELDADSKGIDLYLETEYAVDDIISSFGVLLYSYIPFEDLRFDTLYFNTENLTIPNFYYSDTINPITKEEDYDDSRSTHPNIKTRIDNSFDIIDDRESKGTLQFKISETEFYKIRNLARFEGVRLKLAERLYIEALYDIYLLQKDFSDSEFLEASQMKALYGITKYRNAGRYTEIRTRLSKVEGESYRLHALFQELSKSQMTVIAYRYVYDLIKKYPENSSYKRYEKQLKKALALDDNIEISKFSTEPYESYKDSVDVVIETFDIEDSIRKIEASDLSRYQKIKRKKQLAALTGSSEDLESPTVTNFHYYALGDIVSSDDFIDDLEKIQDENKEYGESESDLVALKQNESISIGLDSIVIIDPYFTLYNVSGENEYEQSEKMQQYFTNLYMDDYSGIDLHREMVSTKSMVKSEVEKYNQLGNMYLYLSEILDHDSDLDFIPSCHQEVQKMSEMYGSTSFLFSKIDVSKERKEFNGYHLYGVALIATIPIVLYDLRTRSYIDYRVILINTETDELIYGDNVSLKLAGNKKNIDFLVFHILKNINSKGN
ncbi:MAG: M48 family metallopeptidase [Crocinitomicaceae bacterium]